MGGRSWVSIPGGQEARVVEKGEGQHELTSITFTNLLRARDRNVCGGNEVPSAEKFETGHHHAASLQVRWVPRWRSRVESSATFIDGDHGRLLPANMQASPVLFVDHRGSKRRWKRERMSIRICAGVSVRTSLCWGLPSWWFELFLLADWVSSQPALPKSSQHCLALMHPRCTLPAPPG